MPKEPEIGDRVLLVTQPRLIEIEGTIEFVNDRIVAIPFNSGRHDNVPRADFAKTMGWDIISSCWRGADPEPAPAE